MPGKPTAEVILKSYSLEELLELAKDKLHQDYDDRMETMRTHLDALNQVVGGGFSSLPKTRRGRPRLDATAPRARSGKKMSLGSYVLEVLGSEPMKVDDILEAIAARGYKSKSDDPRRILYLELKKQVEKNNAEKVERGIYIRKPA